jgi:hypothetical protein
MKISGKKKILGVIKLSGDHQEKLTHFFIHIKKKSTRRNMEFMA